MDIGVTGIPSTLDAWPGRGHEKARRAGLGSFDSVVTMTVITGSGLKVVEVNP